jgi:3-methylfumaryl-CoA hydratase
MRRLAAMQRPRVARASPAFPESRFLCTRSSMNVEYLKSWIGRQEIVEDDLPVVPANALGATLDHETFLHKGDDLPPLWHWIYFLKLHRQSEIGEDGNGRKGEFIPPVPLPRRMFAGAQIFFDRPLKLGQRARRESTIEDLTFKKGRTGELAFLKIKVVIKDDGGVVLTEHQDLVYREPATGTQSAQGAPSRRSADWKETVQPSDPLLFRYSALIFNAHRIHLDRGYAMGQQGYGGLVVHGQLIATMLAELARKHVASRMKSFRFRAIRPILDVAPFSILGARAGEQVMLWAEDAAGEIAMEAEASFAA